MLRKLVLGLLVVAVGVTAFFVLHHPPMRLMPPPLLFQDAGLAGFDVAPLVPDDRIELFYATNRLPVGPAGDRTYTVAPDRQLHLGTATTRIGEGATLDQLIEWTTGATDDRPFIRLERMQEAATLPAGAEPTPEAAAWLAAVDARARRAGGARRARLRARREHHGRARRRAGGAGRALRRAERGRRALRLADGRELPALPAGHPQRLRGGAAPRRPAGAARRPHPRELGRRLHLQRRRDDRQRGAGAARARAARGGGAARRGLPRRAGRRLPRLRRRPRRLRQAGPTGDGRGQPRRQRAPAGAGGEPGLARRAARPARADAGGAPARCSPPPTRASSSCSGCVPRRCPTCRRARTPSGTTTPG